MPSKVQSVVFFTRNGMWNKRSSEKWLKDHGLMPLKEVDRVREGRKITQYRYRIRHPREFKDFRTIELEANPKGSKAKKDKKKKKMDINIVIGIL